MTGSIAVTRPLAGVSAHDRRALAARGSPARGSRRRPAAGRRAGRWANCLRRSSVHTASPRRRRRASSAIADRAPWPGSGRDRSPRWRAGRRARCPASGGGGPGWPARSWRAHVRQPVQRVRHAPAHDEQRDEAEQPPPARRSGSRACCASSHQRAVDVRGVLEDDQHAASPLVDDERDGVVVGLALARGDWNPCLGATSARARGTAGRGAPELGGPLGRRGDEGPGAVVDGDAARGRSRSAGRCDRSARAGPGRSGAPRPP